MAFGAWWVKPVTTFTTGLVLYTLVFEVEYGEKKNCFTALRKAGGTKLSAILDPGVKIYSVDAEDPWKPKDADEEKK